MSTPERPVWPEKTPPTTDGHEKRTLGAGVFRLCDGCGQTLASTELAAMFEVCPHCAYHHRLDTTGWRRLLLDGGHFDEWDAHLSPADPLQFSDGKPYIERIAASQKRARAREAMVIGRGHMEGRAVALGIFEFLFMGGSMGSVVGEKVARLFERAADQGLPVILLQASGGARMQEGILSLMQMAKGVAALERFRAAKLPFISVLRNPTTGGVAASFAFLGDINVAEPKALIGFAGPRVIESTIRQTLPPGFQKAEFLLEHGMIDLIVARADMKATFATLLDHLMGRQA